MNNATRIVKPGREIVSTTPSFRAKPVLEFLSFKLGLTSPREIEEHKNYFDEKTLRAMVKSNPDAAEVRREYFELGTNNLLVITKKAK